VNIFRTKHVIDKLKKSFFFYGEGSPYFPKNYTLLLYAASASHLISPARQRLKTYLFDSNEYHPEPLRVVSVIVSLSTDII